MAQKKGGKNTSNGRDSRSQRLGTKLFGGQLCIPGNIIIRQRGTRFHPGTGVGMGKDHTIFAKVEGFIRFHSKFSKQYVSVDAIEWDENELTDSDSSSALITDAIDTDSKTVIETTKSKQNSQ